MDERVEERDDERDDERTTKTGRRAPPHRSVSDDHSDEDVALASRARDWEEDTGAAAANRRRRRVVRGGLVEGDASEESDDDETATTRGGEGATAASRRAPRGGCARGAFASIHPTIGIDRAPPVADVAPSDRADLGRRGGGVVPHRLRPAREGTRHPLSVRTLRSDRVAVRDNASSDVRRAREFESRRASSRETRATPRRVPRSRAAGGTRGRSSADPRGRRRQGARATHRATRAPSAGIRSRGRFV